ncbi:MAG TPA: hypothetical protein VF936_19165 [Burkholderiales bacterium]
MRLALASLLAASVVACASGVNGARSALELAYVGDGVGTQPRLDRDAGMCRRPAGVVSAAGFIPAGSTPALGDPSSPINRGAFNASKPQPLALPRADADDTDHDFWMCMHAKGWRVAH